MKSINDLFSEDSGGYQKYRPEYPSEFINEIVSMVWEREHCWDCGTGNGQVARMLSEFFKFVEATDISPNQLEFAYKGRNIRYSIGRAEASPFPDDHFDLITVAQAVHWFDFPHFFNEVRRVSKKDAVLAIWGYGLLRFDNDLDPVIDRLYKSLQPYWDQERDHIENNYESIPFPFENISLSRSFAIRREFKQEELMGYLNTWSAVKNFRKKNNYDPLTEFTGGISGFWKKEEKPMEATFPLFTKIGRVT